MKRVWKTQIYRQSEARERKLGREKGRSKAESYEDKGEDVPGRRNSPVQRPSGKGIGTVSRNSKRPVGCTLPQSCFI